MVKMYVPEHLGCVSFNGEEYSPNKKRIIDVPAEALPALLEHGLSVSTESNEDVISDIVKDETYLHLVKMLSEALSDFVGQPINKKLKKEIMEKIPAVLASCGLTTEEVTKYQPYFSNYLDKNPEQFAAEILNASTNT